MNETMLQNVGADRRVWVRYSCDVSSTCHSKRGVDEISWSARVRDISRGGLNVHINRSFEPGSILFIELPLGPDQTVRTLSVKVVRCENAESGNCSLGCQFETPLAEEDLLAFQVKKPIVSNNEKRAWIRFTCDGNRSPQATVLINPNNKIQARILNICKGGIGLETKRFCEPGTPLKLELVDASGRTSRPIQAKVAHSTFQAADHWTTGCSFETPLNDEDLAALI
jgi:hypothetical protein